MKKSKLERLKEALEYQKMLEWLPKLAHNSFCTIELGNSYYPTIEQIDDLYTGFVSGVIGNLGSGKTPTKIEGIGPSSEEESNEGYIALWYSLTQDLGSSTYPFEEWVQQNPESEKWVDYIIAATDIENEYKLDPEKWLTELKMKIRNEQRN